MNSALTTILVLCTGNSARSQMAQCFLSRELGDSARVLSAGTVPAERIHPMTVEVMKEVGFDLAARKPVNVRDYLGKVHAQTLIIVCEGAARACPSVWPGVMARLSWPFEDPAAFQGSEAETREKFREVRDAIEARVREYVREQRMGGTSAVPGTRRPR